MGVIEFFINACTDLAFLPALLQVARHRRHFELYIGVFQLLAAFMYNASQAVGFGVFISEGNWHFISDILTLTYVCCLLVHIMGNEDENWNIVLRYVAFTLCWIFKLRDRFDTALWETGLVVVYLFLAIYGVSKQTKSMRDQYDYQALKFGAISLVAALAFLAIELSVGSDSYGVLLGCVHCLGATTAYFLWRGIPVFDTKKDDDILRKSALFV